MNKYFPEAQVQIASGQRQQSKVLWSSLIMNTELQKRSSVPLKRSLFGVVSALLLLPVPTYAIVFSTVTWTSNFELEGTNPIFSNGPPPDITYASSATQTVLTFKAPGGVYEGKSVVTSSPIPIAEGTETLRGIWGNLNNLNIVDGGIAISITVTDGVPNNNMFGPTTFIAPPSPSPTIDNRAISNGAVITITFDYTVATTGGVELNEPSSVFTLTFTTGP